MKSRKFIFGPSALIVSSIIPCLLSQEAPMPEHATPKLTSFSGPPPDVIPQLPYQGLNDPRWPIFWAKREKDPAMEWKTPIEFYGKVVDQDGKPVAGVVVGMEWTDMSPKGTSEAMRTTNSAGFFSITGIRGKNFGVRSLVKDGYVPFRQSNPHSFEYAGFWEPSYHVPDKKKPVIFRLRKKGEAAALLHFGPTLFEVKPDGTPAVFDLATERKNIGTGDISVRMTRGKKSANRQFDWEVTIEAVGAGAGLIESKEEFMVETPKDGYQAGWKFSQKAGSENYEPELQTKFFVKTAEGKFARIEIRVLPQYNDTGALDLVSYLNPKTGDRNLEFDRAKAIKMP